MARGESGRSLAPGFRFHPTDEELVRYYLKRKVTNKPFRFDPISFIDIYKSEPWDLPGKSKLKSRDLEWYFFSVLDKKYQNGLKTNRATEKGYWKTTGKDRPILWNSRTVGMKKTLVYHLGRAPHGKRTNWVMHEYRLADEELEKAGIAQDAFVLCRIFQKSGSGPKNGEQYGAPFVEEEWDNDEEVAVLPGAVLPSAEEVTVPQEEFVETNDFDQNFDVQTSSENASPINFYDGTSYFVEHPADFIDTGLKSVIDGGITGYHADLPDDPDLLGLPGQHAMDSQLVKDAFGEQSSNNVDTADFDYSFDPYFVDNSHTKDFFGYNNDTLNSLESDPLVDSTGFDLVEDYLNFFDAEDENLTFDPSELFGSENAAYDQAHSFKKDLIGESKEESITDSKQSEMHVNHNASSSNKKPEPLEFEPDTKPASIKQAGYMLGGIPAPPAFASEFPFKGADLQINPGESSTPIHVTTGIIRIESRPLAGDSIGRPSGNSRDLNIIFSFGSSQVNRTLMPMNSLFSGKAGSLISLDWLLWIVMFSVSHKVGVYVCCLVTSVQ